MSATRIGVLALTLGSASGVGAQVVTGGVGLGYGTYPVAPAMVVPVYPYPYGGGYGYPDPLRFGDELPSCYRFGRCSLRELELFRDRSHRLDRLAPTAPEGVRAVPEEPRGRAVAPTPEENIRPEYRGASVPRAEFSGSGTPR